MQLSNVSLAQQVDSKGFALLPGAIDTALLIELERIVSEVALDLDGIAGLRSPLGSSSSLRRLCSTTSIISWATAVIGRDAFVARSILFNKGPSSNWNVSWHQDTTIAVRERHDSDGFGPWSMKEGIPHVRPPAWVLEQMVTIRIHLDDCYRDNGALQVVPGSHRHGILDTGEIAHRVERGPIEYCELAAGGVMLMRPLLLHASRKAIRPSRRRVLHLEFASNQLPDGLNWAEDCGSLTSVQ